MIKELHKLLKEDPKEFFGSIAILILIFGLCYCLLWVDAIISGRV